MLPRLAVHLLWPLVLLHARPARANELSHSVGTPQSGRLVGGVELPPRGDGWVFESNRGNATARFGTGALVRTVALAASRVRESHPGATLVVMDMSLPGGGPIGGHASHRSGRDADLRLYAVDGRGAPVIAPGELGYGPDGRARDGSDLFFDDARNWTLVAALLDSPWASVQAIFIHPALESRLVRHGRRHAPPALVDLAAHRMRPAGTRRASPHDDHLHVRIACPTADGDLCRDAFRRHRRVSAAPSARGSRLGWRTLAGLATSRW